MATSTSQLFICSTTCEVKRTCYLFDIAKSLGRIRERGSYNTDIENLLVNKLYRHLYRWQNWCLYNFLTSLILVHLSYMVEQNQIALLNGVL